jgi:hypothetical protein
VVRRASGFRSDVLFKRCVLQRTFNEYDNCVSPDNKKKKQVTYPAAA